MRNKPPKTLGVTKRRSSQRRRPRDAGPVDETFQEVAILAAAGLTDGEIETELDLEIGELSSLLDGRPDLHDALQQGRENAIRRAEGAIYERAIGPTTTFKNVFNAKGQLTRVVQTTAPPDVRAALQFLRAYDPSGRWQNPRARRPRSGSRTEKAKYEPIDAGEAASKVLALLQSVDSERNVS